MKIARKNFTESIICCAPAMILVSLMIYIPFLLSGYYSLTKWDGIAREPVFIGLDNFRTIFTRGSDFLTALIFTGRYTLFFMIFANIFALAIAMVLVQKFRFANFLRGAFFIPYILSMIIVGFIWRFIFSQGFDRLFEMTGLAFFNYSWLGTINLAFASVVFVGVWQSLGFYIVLYIAGLKAIPAEVLEAATVDGAVGWTRLIKVTIPLLWPSVITCMFMSLTNSLKVFDIILALTRGGPGGATNSAAMNIYREAFQNNNYGLGSAKALVYFVIVLLLTQIVLSLLRRRQFEY